MPRVYGFAAPFACAARFAVLQSAGRNRSRRMRPLRSPSTRRPSLRRLPARAPAGLLLPMLLLPALLLLPPPLAAQQVYKWKDAAGVTHFSSEPPPDGRYEAREVDHHQAAPVAAGADAAATSATTPHAEDPGCATARSNLALLAGDKPLTMDSDGSGKPRPLSDADRTRQRNLAQAILDAKCHGDAAAPATTAGAEAAPEAEPAAEPEPEPEPEGQ
jgi:hypothetical protein